jgi:hypothetical protein
MRTQIMVIIGLSLASTTAQAGNYGENTGVGSAGWGGGADAGTSLTEPMRRSMPLAGDIPDVGECPGCDGGSIGAALRNLVDRMFGTNEHLASTTYDFTATGGIGIGSDGQMDPGSRGSGIDGGSPW